jgi:hypothetical protein
MYAKMQICRCRFFLSLDVRGLESFLPESSRNPKKYQYRCMLLLIHTHTQIIRGGNQKPAEW